MGEKAPAIAALIVQQHASNYLSQETNDLNGAFATRACLLYGPQ